MSAAVKAYFGSSTTVALSIRMQSFAQSRAIRRQARAHIQTARQTCRQAVNGIENRIQRDSEMPTDTNNSETNSFNKQQPYNEVKLVKDGTTDSEAIPNAAASGSMAVENLVQSQAGFSVRHGLENSINEPVFVVSWQGSDDPSNPKTWSVLKRAVVTFEVSLISAVTVIASSITSTVLPQAAQDFGVSRVTESLATGLFHPLLPQIQHVDFFVHLRLVLRRRWYWIAH